MLMSCEKNVLTKLNNENINNLAITNEHFKKKLLFQF